MLPLLQQITFSPSAFPPLAIGFFGLGTGYLVYGPQELFDWPPNEGTVGYATGLWGIWMPGACQLVAGLIIFIGLSWFEVFKDPALYGAALAFTAYGIHWFVLGTIRQKGLDPRPSVGMCVAYFILSLLGCAIFFGAGDWPVGLLFVGLSLIYMSDFFASLGRHKAKRWLGFWHLVTGVWLMYLTIATGLNFTLGTHLPL